MKETPFLPPDTVRVVAQRGLDLHQKDGDQDCEERDIAKAIVSESPLSQEQFEKLSSFFAKGREWRISSRQRGSSGYCRWLMLGGMLGLSWVKALERKNQANKGRLQRMVRSKKKGGRNRFSAIVSRVSQG